MAFNWDFDKPKLPGEALAWHIAECGGRDETLALRGAGAMWAWRITRPPTRPMGLWPASRVFDDFLEGGRPGPAPRAVDARTQKLVAAYEERGEVIKVIPEGVQTDPKWKVLERSKITVKAKSSAPYQGYHGATEDKLIKMLDDTGRDRRIVSTKYSGEPSILRLKERRIQAARDRKKRIRDLAAQRTAEMRTGSGARYDRGPCLSPKSETWARPTDTQVSPDLPASNRYELRGPDLSPQPRVNQMPGPATLATAGKAPLPSRSKRKDLALIANNVRRLCKNHAGVDCEDALQGVLELIFKYKDLDKFDPAIANLKTFVSNVIDKRFKDYLRSLNTRSNKLAITHSINDHVDEEETVELEEKLCAEAEDEDRLAYVIEAFEILTEKEYEVVVGTAFDGKSIKELAEEMGVSTQRLYELRLSAKIKINEYYKTSTSDSAGCA